MVIAILLPVGHKYNQNTGVATLEQYSKNAIISLVKYIYPEAHSIVIERVVFGLLWALVPTLALIVLFIVVQVLSFALWATLIIGIISLVVYLLSRPTFW